MTEQLKDKPVVADQLNDELLEESQDDAVIGRAFRWSLGFILVVGGGIGAMVWLLSRPEPVVAVPPKDSAKPQPRDTSAKLAAVSFTDVASAAGIDFVHANGATGEKLLPETMGGGCAFLDYDNDGDQDIVLVNSTIWPNAKNPPAQPPTTALYRNDGAGKFANVTAGSGLEAASFYGMGIACADYDADGDVDLFITAVGLNHLYRNESGRFTDVAAAAGVAGTADQWSTSAGFLDYDNDGRLDLFVCNYVKWSRDIDFAVNYTLTGIGRAYGPPNNFEGTDSYLYHNNGDGTFSDVSARAGIHVKHPALGQPMGKALGLAPADVDRDGWMDLFVANDTVRRFFFHNNKDGTFTECGEKYGLAYDPNGNATGAMGVDSAYYRNDASLAFVIGNFANQPSSFLVAQPGSMHFTDDAVIAGIGGPTRSKLKFGAFFFDYDLDGRLDLLQANGHIEDQININQPSQKYRQQAQLFWNCGPTAPSSYAEVPAREIGDLAREIVGRGAAFADIDGDGDLDALLTQIAGPPLLLRNEQALGHHWLRVWLKGAAPNRDAIGARIELASGGATQLRQVMPTRSYISQVELPVTFGLGSAAKVDSLKITWPDGSVQSVTVPNVDRMITVEQAPAKG